MAIDQKAWNDYFAAMQSAVKGAWGQAVASYKGLEKTRATLGLPMIGQTSPEGIPDAGGWSQGLDQEIANLQAMVTIVEGALSDAISGKRQVAHLGNGNIAIAALPEDKVIISEDGGGPYLSTPSGVEIQAKKGSVGLPWVPVLVAGSVVTIAQVYLITKAVDSVTVMAQEKTTRTIAERDERLIKSGKATPAEVAALTKATYEGAESVKKAQAEASPASDLVKVGDQFTKTITTVAWIGLGAAVIYGIFKFLPAMKGGGAPALARNPLEENPTEIDRISARELVLLVNRDSRFSPRGQGRGRSIALNLIRKMINGTYNHGKAAKAWMYVVDDAARASAGGVFGRGRPPPSRGWLNRVYPKSSRESAARMLAADFYRDVRDGEYVHLLPELKRLPFFLRKDEAESLCGFIGSRYRSAELLCDGYDPETQSISITKAKQALRATPGDGGDYGTVPLAGGGLKHSIDKLWTLLAAHEGLGA